MLTIRKEQMEALSADRLRSFENQMVKHIAGAFPAKFRQIGEVETRTLIHEGIAKAATYAIESERNVALFIDLMVAISPGFDHDDGSSWMQPILQHPEMPEQTKLDMIYDRMRRTAPEIALPRSPDAGR